MGDPLPDPNRYRRLIGKLNFLQHTRSDITFVVQHFSQFLQTSQSSHMLVGLHVLRYLLNAPVQGILLSKADDFSLRAYCDADWVGYASLRKSVSVFLSLLEVVSFLGKAKSSLLFHSLPRRLNIVHYRKLLLKSLGWFKFLTILDYLLLILFLLIVTVRLHFTLPKIRCFMSAQSILM